MVNYVHPICGSEGTTGYIPPVSEEDKITMSEIEGHYLWKHDGQNSNGDMTLHADGTLDQYHPHLAGSTWYINDNNEIVLEWSGDHVLTRIPYTKHWLMLSRDPASILEWVGPLLLTMEVVAGRYAWKHDGQNTSG